MRLIFRLLALVLAALSPGSPVAAAAEVKVMVASNFTGPAKDIAAKFEKATGHVVVLSFGATGQLYVQITQGAPFDVFLAADQATPQKAIAEGHAVSGSAFTYATGKLVLYSATKGVVEGETTLQAGNFDKLAIANPATAPYGAAAVEVMRKLAVWDALQPKIVHGQNISQTLQFVETGNAELGFVALAQVLDADGGSRWLVPDYLHAPIFQDAVLLKAGERNAAAQAFLGFLKEAGARAVIERFGYGLVN